MADLIQYEYKNNLISFEIDEEIMLNATQMAKPFGKMVKDFLKNKEIKEYINSLKKSRQSVRWENSPNGQIVIVVQGGNPEKQGTWMHRLLAIRFAMWLNADFAVWVIEKIDTLLQNGSVTLSTQNNADFSPSQKAYLEQTFATKADLKNLGEYLINENDWNQAVTVADNFMKYVATMLQKIEEYQVHQDILLSNLEEALNLLDVDILKKAVREILAGAKMLKTEIPHYIYLFKEERTGFYKIGHSKDPLKRKSQFGLWKELTMVHQIKVSSKGKTILGEKLLQHIFKEKVLDREWFALIEEDVAFFCSL